MMDERNRRAPRGVAAFFSGFALAAVGALLLTNQVTVGTGYWYGIHLSSFGWAFVPLFLGLALLFFDARLKAGWLLTLAGAAVVVGALVLSLRGYFRPVSLTYLLFMLGLVAGGLGLMAGALRRDSAR